MPPRSTIKRSLLQTALLLAPLPAMLVAVTAAPAAAQGRRIAPNHTVMGVRLAGVWQDSEFRFFFKLLENGTVELKKARRSDNILLAQGVLENAPAEGAMIGTISGCSAPHCSEKIKAWISDDHRLWINGRNADGAGFFERVSKTTTPADVARAWVGDWRTSQGLLKIEADNGNLFGWLTREGDKRKERVAIRADAKNGSGGWDSEYDERGEWLHKPVRWGDLTLFLSADGNSFTGMHSSTRPGMVGLYEQSWTGERVDKRPQGSGSDPTIPIGRDPFPDEVIDKPTVDLIRLTGSWKSPLGRLVVYGGSSKRGAIVGNLQQSSGITLSFMIWPSKGVLIGEGLPDRSESRKLKARLVDDETLELSITDGPSLQGRATLMATRDAASFESAALSGEWKTSLGMLNLRTEGGHLTGTVIPDHGGSEGRMLLALHHYDERSRWLAALSGAWKAAVTGVPGEGTMTFEPSADGKSFTGTYTRMVAGKPIEQGWSGRKVVEEQPPAPAPRPTTTPAPGPGPAPSNPAPAPVPEAEAEAPADGFQPLGKWDVRLDRVENPRDDRLTHVYLTLRNAATRDLLQTEDVWVYLEAGGMEQKSGQGLRAQPGYPKLFGSPPPVVRPGKEIRTKFVFDRQDRAGPITVTIEENGERAVYDF